jgi:hypothetical protein
MGITELSSQKSKRLQQKIFCSVRQMFVAQTPEECVRQKLLDFLFESLGYPKHLTRVELSICFFTQSHPTPQRRLDIVCFHKKEDSLLPLLLIECKAQFPHQSAVTQLVGYNFFVKAPFTAIAWNNEIILHHDKILTYEGDVKGLPSYQQLVEMIR